MKKTSSLMALLTLVVVYTAGGIPSEEECYGGVQDALANIVNGSKALAGSNYLSAGVCYRDRMEYVKAADCFLKAAKLRNETGGISGVAYVAAGDMYVKAGEEEKARECYTSAVDSYIKADKLDVSLARVYRKLGNHTNSCKYCEMDEDFDPQKCRREGFCREDTPLIPIPGGITLVFVSIVAVFMAIGIIVIILRGME